MDGQAPAEIGDLPKPARRRPAQGPDRGNPYVEKRAHLRRISLDRSLARVRVPLGERLREAPPAPRRPSWHKGLAGISVLVLSLGLHLAFLVAAFGIGRLGARAVKPRERLAIEVREARPKPDAKPVSQERAPSPSRPERVPAQKVPPPKVEPPEPKVKPAAPPPRIVGLSFSATTGEAGEGAAFAVGETRQGETEQIAAAPRQGPQAAVNQRPAAGPANQLATHVPGAGVTFTQPKPKRRVEPIYPTMLKTQGVEADVVVLVAIDAQGKVTKVQVLKGTPYPEFNEAARQAALADEFEPATRNGEPIAYSLKYTISFRLKDE